MPPIYIKNLKNKMKKKKAFKKKNDEKKETNHIPTHEEAVANAVKIAKKNLNLI